MGWYDSDVLRGLRLLGLQLGGRTHPVGQKKPNDFDLYDMHGNVWEWCEDRYRADYLWEKRKDSEVLHLDTRVMRGGSWNTPARVCRSAFRAGQDLSFRHRSYGFRPTWSSP